MKSALAVACLVLASSFAFATGPNELLEPPVFTSHNGTLDILITAKAKPITLDTLSPTAWVYEVCYRGDATNNICPNDSRTASEYGGMRLQLQPGDHLKIRFINQLPPAPPDAEHAQGPMGEMLKNNPTNLHTHGLIVEPRRATQVDPTYGDYIYVLAYPNGKLPSMQMPGMDYTDQPLDYDIYVPTNHPSGLFWIHPHAHGLALNQISEGMAGIITIGNVSGYVSRTGGMFGQGAPATGTFAQGASAAGTFGQAAPTVRHLTLKDMQVYADSTVFSQEDPEFCWPDPVNEPARNGFCAGADHSDEDGGDYTGGKWFFTVNGQVYPTITLSPSGEIWRITHASGSRSYDLAIVDDATGQLRPFQVLAIDGVTINSSGGSQALSRAAGGKFVPATCNFSMPGKAANPICGTSLRMMPSSRIEIYVPTSPQGGSATLLTRVYVTGGDDWPSANLARIDLSSGLSKPAMGVSLIGSANSLLTSTGILGAPVRIDGPGKSGGISLQNAPKLSRQLPPSEWAALQAHLSSLSAPSDVPSAPCVALPLGHHRRIFFGVPKGDPDAFGLGYEEVDQRGRPVPGTFRDITEFDHSVIDVCLPLAKGNNAVNEAWELVNVHDEDHNFHIHQTKFRLAVASAAAGAAPGTLVDNVPVLHGSGDCDGSIDTWRSGACHVQPVWVSIPFSQVGDFVYHCHILEHEDGGMMAHIRVIPNP